MDTDTSVAAGRGYFLLGLALAGPHIFVRGQPVAWCKGSFKSRFNSTLIIVCLFLLFNSLPTPSPHCHYLPFPMLLILHCPFTASMIFLLFHHSIIMQCSSALYLVSLFNYLTPSWHSYPVQAQPHDVLFKAYFRVVLEYRYFNILWYSTITYCLFYTC